MKRGGSFTLSAGHHKGVQQVTQRLQGARRRLPQMRTEQALQGTTTSPPAFLSEQLAEVTDGRMQRHDQQMSESWGQG